MHVPKRARKDLQRARNVLARDISCEEMIFEFCLINLFAFLRIVLVFLIVSVQVWDSYNL